MVGLRKAKSILQLIVAHIILYSSMSPLKAEPWFTGPLIASSGTVIPVGKVNLEPYFYYTVNDGVFNQHGRHIHLPRNTSKVISPSITVGVVKNFDFAVSAAYLFNSNDVANAQHFGDSSLELGYQALLQADSKWRPDLRITLDQSIPTGKFDNLNTALNGADATGSGSYRTAVAFNFQLLRHWYGEHYFRTRLSLGYEYARQVAVTGANTYGGNANTSGSVHVGNQKSFDIATELTLAKHWVAVMEAYWAHRSGTYFVGAPGASAAGIPLSIGHGSVDTISLAPALEYNHNEHIGIIAGYWFTVKGTDTADSRSVVIAVNAYW